MDEKQNKQTGNTGAGETVQPAAAPYPTGPAYPQIGMKDMNAPPPTYGQVYAPHPTDGQVGWMQQTANQQTGNPAHQVEGANYNLEKHSVQVRCTRCFKEQFTRVDSKVSSNGKIWAILCCCFGSWILSLLVLCMEGFREFYHYCPSCNSLIGSYKPKFSGAMIGLLVLVTLGIIALEVVVIIFVVLPRLSQQRSSYYG